jgi:hypothetical protein
LGIAHAALFSPNFMVLESTATGRHNHGFKIYQMGVRARDDVRRCDAFR